MPRTPPDMHPGGKPSSSERSENTTPKLQPLASKDEPHEDSPRLPHERDESSDSHGAAPQPHPSQAAKDVEAGLTDTSKANETDEAYQKQGRGSEGSQGRGGEGSQGRHRQGGR